jgi:HTH-type transcriptional regulator, sugar sensing transcriptional regulator
MHLSTKTVTQYSKELQELGFTDYEAKIYISLLQLSPVTAYEISKNNALPRPNVYSALDSLEKKQAVQRVSLDPVRFVPVNPTTLFSRISKAVQDRCLALEVGLEKLQPEVKTHYVWNIDSTDEARLKISQLILAAKSHIWIKAHYEELLPHLEELKLASKRGVSLLFILFGDAKQIQQFNFSKNCNIFSHEGDGTVVGLGRYLITLSIDFKEALVMNMKEHTGAFTQSEPIVNMADSLIRHEIYLAEIFKHFSKLLEAKFEPGLFELRKKYLPKDQITELKQHIQKMKSPIKPKSK